MDFIPAYDFASVRASNDFGSNVIDTINNREISNAVYHFNHMVNSLNALSDIFETQKLAHDKGKMDGLDEFNGYVKELIEGDGQELQGLIKRLKIFFWNQEFKRDPPKKKAMALFLKYYTEYLRDHSIFVPIEEFMKLIEQKRYNGNYFDKNYVFGQLLDIINQNTQ